MIKYKKINKCRLCKSNRIKKIKDLCISPLANNLLNTKKESLIAEKYPLSIFFCNNCYHLQLGHIINKNLLFSKYLYTSGISNNLKKHFKKLSHEIKKNFMYDSNKNYKLLEIGSNDSTFLNYVKNKNITTIGVEPAQNLKQYFYGHDILNGFFDKKTNILIKKKYSNVDFIVANNVFAHIENLDNVFDCINEIIHENSIIIFEVSYLVDVINKNLVDTIYHEHLDYHKLISLNKFFKIKNLKLFDIKLIKSHGGSIRCYLTKSTNKIKIKKNVLNQLKYEKINNFNLITKYKKYFSKVENNRKKIEKLFESHNINEMIGYGAPAKLVTFLSLYFTNKKTLKFVIDASPLKQNKFIPGFDIKVVSKRKLLDRKYKYVVIFAWNLYKEIIINLEKYSNIKYFIVIAPNLKIIRNKNYAVKI